MTQAVLDGATRPVYYESRVIKLKLDDKILAQIDAEYSVLAKNADEEVIEKSKRELGKMEAILGHEKTVNSLVDDILEHYENERQYLYTGKAMIVAYNRAIAMKIFNRILELRPSWAGTTSQVTIGSKQIAVPGDDARIALVMTESNKDPEEWRAFIGNKTRRQELAARFKDNDSPLKIAIVVDMWLTGFDVPSLATMYVYKPMESYNLMQAIARVNRVFKDKEGGLVVDYVGIASALKKAMNDYTARDRENYGEMDVAKRAYPKFQEKLEICRNLFFGYDYTLFYEGSDLQRGMTISGAVNFIVAPNKEEQKQSFIKEALMLKQALSLCSSMVKQNMRLEAAFFEAVRVLVMRLLYNPSNKKFSLKEINERINELLTHSVKSDGVINLFSDVGEKVNLFDPTFLENIGKMKEKNLAVEMLKKLIDDQVKVYKRTNLVKSEAFSVLIQQALNRYLNGMLTNEEVIQELLNLAKELTETLRKNKTIDWQKKESARAKMRMIVKKLLKKYKYPPEGQDDALKTVISQCELWTDVIADFDAYPMSDGYGVLKVAEPQLEYMS